MATALINAAGVGTDGQSACGTGAAPLSLLGPMATKMNFGYIAKYNKSGSNLQASANIIVRTSCMTSAALQQLGLN